VRFPRSGHLRDRTGWDGKGHGLIEAAAALKAVVELADHAVEEVALGGCAPVPVVVAAAPVVNLAPGEAVIAEKAQR
jgi:hypothetical protein